MAEPDVAATDASQRTAYSKATCPACDRLYALRADGTLRFHRDPDQERPCPGAGRIPTSNPQGDARMTASVTVHWYEHDCPWVTKYCDENHVKAAVVPREVLRQYEVPCAPNDPSAKQAGASNPQSDEQAKRETMP